ncbi:DUF2975 domain-containing protein [Vibrio salinus]|uniref:DUF2975 domain-containing protein n=1 Tax=Vibrio salinus TaxID=2899784 RepID=UPI00356A8133
MTPILVCAFWLTIETSYDFLAQLGIFLSGDELKTYTQLPLTMTSRILAMVVSLLLSGVFMYALKVLIRIFRNYENRVIFSLDNAICYHRLGYCIFYWALGSIVYHSLMSVILSFNNPPGSRVLTVTFGDMDFLTLVFGCIVLIISWVMKEGYLLAEENSHTI